MRKCSCAFVFVLCLLSHESRGQLSVLETEHLRLVYHSIAHEFLVPHIARSFENALSFHRSLFAYTPSEKITLILHDFNDHGNAGADAVPKNYITLGIAPFSYVYETMPASERMTWLMNHELVHIVALDRPSNTDKAYRNIFFGKVRPHQENPVSMLYAYLTTPRRYSPRWYHEGIAVFLETWMAGGLGRALGSYDEMVFRTMVRDSSRIYDFVGLESEGTTIDFQVGVNSYLYGTRFMSYLAYRHSPEKLIEWVNRTDNSDRYYATYFQSLFGKSLDEEWSDWIRWEHEWQRSNLDSIRLFPVTSYRPVFSEALGSVSRSYYDSSSGTLLSAVRYPGQMAHLTAIDLVKGSRKVLQEIRGPSLFNVSSIAYDAERRLLFYTTDNNKWRNLNSYDLNSGRARVLINDVRTGDLAFNVQDRSLWGIRHAGGYSTLVRIPYPYNEWNQIHTWKYGYDMFDIDISPDGTTLTGALADLSGNQFLIKCDVKKLIAGDASYEVLFDFENSTPANFVFSPDGKFLFGTSYYSGVSNVVRYEFASKQMEWLTNAETGFFRPVPYIEDSLIVFQYTGKGFQPVMIANRPVRDVSAIRFLGQEIVNRSPVVRSWLLPSPAKRGIDLDSLTVYAGPYHPSRDISLGAAYPVVEGYKNSAAFGWRFDLYDPVFIHRIDLTASYSPSRSLSSVERLHASFNYHFWQWSVSGTYNGADFYDLFGPTKTSRKGYSLSIQHRDFLIHDEPDFLDYRLALGTYWGLERLPDFQNVSTSFDRFLTFNARLNFHSMSKSLGAVDDEQGIQWQATTHTNFVNGRVFPRLWSGLTYGALLPLNHSSLWVHSSAGYSMGAKSEPFANFFFGGFGNNWVDHREVRRYREYYSFPGLPLNDVGGTNFVKLTGEWTLPPLRFRRFGFPMLYSNWLRTSLFASAVRTNIADSAPLRRTVTNVGGQIDLRLVLFSSMQSTLSVGYAAAFEAGRPMSKEFMISLRIL